jgi:hypothetical protein
VLANSAKMKLSKVNLVAKAEAMVVVNRGPGGDVG